MSNSDAEIDALLAEAARAHTAETGHPTTNWPGEGWGCQVCDPDLFEDKEGS